MTCREAKPLLGAWLDDELEPRSRAAIQQHCHDCDACAAEVEEIERLSAAVSAAPYYLADASLRARFQPAARRSKPAIWMALAAGLAAAAVIGIGVGSHSDLARDVVQAHVRSLTGGRLMDIEASGPHSVTPWLASKLDFRLRVEDVSGPGFVLLGGRLDHLASRPVATLVYRRGPHVINVFVWPARQQPDRLPDARTVRGFNVVDWRADGLNWWAVSDLSLGELQQMPLCPCFLPAHETLRG